MDTLGYYSQRTAMGASSFVVTFRYNARMDRWIMDIADANLVMLKRGVPLLTGWASLKTFNGLIPGLPAGYLVPTDLTGQERDPQEKTLGTDVPLLYVEF